MRTPVTMPGTLVTVLPFCGDRKLGPWMSWMARGRGGPPQAPPPQPAVGSPGVGAAAVKSVEFWSVSGVVTRWAEVVLLGAGASAVPSWTTAVP